MKAHSFFLASRKPLVIATLASLMLGAGLARADGRSCLFDAPAPQASSGQSFAYPQEIRQQMARIETALRNGQITPFEAGQLMRQQWEIAQFQRGFLASGAPAAQPSGTGGCGLGLGLGPELGAKIGAKIGPLVGDMAKNGMQTASTVMRAIRRETERLLMEELPSESPEL